MGGLQAKSMTSQRAANKMADMRCYDKVMTTTRWRLYIIKNTIITCSVYTTAKVQSERVIDVFYIFNSTVID